MSAIDVLPPVHDGFRPVDDPLLEALRALELLQLHTNHVNRVVAGLVGVGPSDLRALTFIARSEEATPKRIADYLEMTTGATTSLVDRMETANLVERVPHPSDRRSIRLQLAPEGERVMSQLSDFYRRVISAAIDPAELERLTMNVSSLSSTLLSMADAEIAAR
jgi:DNA-binding MarR family transcriptional regulator